jgi:hypothetical protein
MSNPLPDCSPADQIHALLHRLWTKAVGGPDYDKSEWRDLEAALAAQRQAVRAFLEASGQDLCHENRRDLAAAFGLPELAPALVGEDEFRRGCAAYRRHLYGGPPAGAPSPWDDTHNHPDPAAHAARRPASPELRAWARGLAEAWRRAVFCGEAGYHVAVEAALRDLTRALDDEEALADWPGSPSLTKAIGLRTVYLTRQEADRLDEACPGLFGPRPGQPTPDDWAAARQALSEGEVLDRLAYLFARVRQLETVAPAPAAAGD